MKKELVPKYHKNLESRNSIAMKVKINYQMLAKGYLSTM